MSETRAVISTRFGNIELRFFSDVSPNHVNNFIKLAGEGFYDGTTFHRVIPDFLIQGATRIPGVRIVRPTGKEGPGIP